jgi:hypothetical protein
MRILTAILLATTLATAAEPLKAESFKGDSAVIAQDGTAVVFTVDASKGAQLGEAVMALGKSYAKKATLTATVTAPAAIQFPNFTVYLGESATGQRVGAGIQMGEQRAWIYEHQGLQNKLGQPAELKDVPFAGSYQLVLTVDLVAKTATATFNGAKLEGAIAAAKPAALDSLVLTSYTQGVKISDVSVTGE